MAPFSTLELVKHDSTANAPETDLAFIAPEVDQTAETPQVNLLYTFPNSQNRLIPLIGYFRR